LIPKSYVGQSLYFPIQGTKHVLKSTHPFFHVGLYFLRISPNINNGTCNDYSMFFDSLDAVLRTWCKYGMVYIVAARGIHIRPSNSVSTILSLSAKGRIAVSESWLPVWLPTLRRKKKKRKKKEKSTAPEHLKHELFLKRLGEKLALKRTASSDSSPPSVSASGNQWGPRCLLVQLSAPLSLFRLTRYHSACQLLYRHTGKRKFGFPFFWINIYLSFPVINMRGRFVVTLLWNVICAISFAVLRVG